MKKTKNIFSLLTCLLFLISFLLCSYNSIAGTAVSVFKDQIHTHFDSKQNTNNNNSGQQCSEASEPESENNYAAPVLILNFVGAYSQSTTSHTANISAQPLSEKIANAIYISVRNFRI